MKTALLGYGRMGKTIESIATQRGHEIVLKIGRNNTDEMTPENLRKANVAIDFSLPDTAFANIAACLRAGVPVVSGTTGWLDDFAEAQRLCEAEKGAFFYASNFSVGVNIFMQINERLAELMSGQSAYRVGMTEIHHTRKLDAPSGTAITLAEQILEKNERLQGYTLDDKEAENRIKIDSIREGDVPGTHLIEYASETDSLEIKHTAHGRKGFALGAVLAAEWLVGKAGNFGMKDMLRF